MDVRWKGYVLGCSELNYIIINVYSRSTLLCLKWKGKIVWAYFYYFDFYFYTYFFFSHLSGKALLIKIIIVKVLLMLIFFTNVIKFLYNFLHTCVTVFLKVTNYFGHTWNSWTQDTGHWILDTGLWTLHSGGWKLDCGLMALDGGLWTLKL